MSTDDGILRPMFEIFFTLFPTGYFLQIINVIADLISGFAGLFGIDLPIVGF